MNSQTFFLSFFSGWLCQTGGLNKDPTVWLVGARPACTYIPPSFLGYVPVQLRNVPTPKIHLQKQKNQLFFDKITFYMGNKNHRFSLKD
jgi:hypothetical protein